MVSSVLALAEFGSAKSVTRRPVVLAGKKLDTLHVKEYRYLILHISVRIIAHCHQCVI